MVHSRSAPVDFGFLRQMAVEAGAPEALAKEVGEANTATEAGNLMKEAGFNSFFTLLCKKAGKAGYDHVGGGLEVEVVLMTMKNELLGRYVYGGERYEEESS